MADFLLLMHDDTTSSPNAAMWDAYFTTLRASGRFDGGSSIGTGESFRREGVAGSVAGHLVGFIRVRAADLAEARTFLTGNPVYESGGTVEIRALPTD